MTVSSFPASMGSFGHIKSSIASVAGPPISSLPLVYEVHRLEHFFNAAGLPKG